MLWETNQDFQQVMDLTHSNTARTKPLLQMPGTKFCTKIDIFYYSMNESANAVQKCTCMTFLPWFPSLSLCLRCAIPDRMVVAMAHDQQQHCRRLHTSLQGYAVK